MVDLGRSAALVSLFLALGCAPTKGDGVSLTEMRSIVEPFDGVRVNDGIFVDLTLDLANAGEVIVTSDSNLVPMIATQVVDGVLEIFAGSIEPTVSTIDCPSGLCVQVTMATFASASAADSSFVALTGIDRTGAAELGILAINLSEGSIGEFSGACTRLIAIVTGPSTLSAATLGCEQGEFDVLDGAVVDAQTTESAIVRASGASVIRLTGSPTDVQSNLTSDATLTVE